MKWRRLRSEGKVSELRIAKFGSRRILYVRPFESRMIEQTVCRMRPLAVIMWIAEGAFYALRCAKIAAAKRFVGSRVFNSNANDIKCFKGLATAAGISLPC